VSFRLLQRADLEHELRLVPLAGRRDDLGSRFHVGGVGDVRARSRSFLDPDVEAETHEFAYRFGGGRDAVLTRTGFDGDEYDGHGAHCNRDLRTSGNTRMECVDLST